MDKPRHYNEQQFEALVSSALDELPIEFQRALEHVAIVVSDRGAQNHAYGMYVGSKLGGSAYFGGGGLPDEILIFRDTLVRDFGDDPSACGHTSSRRCVTRLLTTSASTRQAFANSGSEPSRRPRQGTLGRDSHEKSRPDTLPRGGVIRGRDAVLAQ